MSAYPLSLSPATIAVDAADKPLAVVVDLNQRTMAVVLSKNKAKEMKRRAGQRKATHWRAGQR
jgi:hypothetical protein